LFNHESSLRPERFVTQKIVTAAKRIANGDRTPLYLGNLAVRRDWGWAPEYVEAMYLMLQQEQPDDYVIATGKSYSLEDFVAETFAAVGLEWQAHVSIEKSLFRPTDLAVGLGNPAKAKLKLGWAAKYQMPDVVRMMMSQQFYQNGFKQQQNLAVA
jgi:GDPmannose 4,6-dehydratase